MVCKIIYILYILYILYIYIYYIYYIYIIYIIYILYINPFLLSLYYLLLLTRFKNEFPYYYDQCLESTCLNKQNNQYFGTVCPSKLEYGEDSTAATRTELYVCGRCQTISRFPRYYRMSKVNIMCVRSTYTVYNI